MSGLPALLAADVGFSAGFDLFHLDQIPPKTKKTNDVQPLTSASTPNNFGRLYA
ncbi:hypothetical protein [Hoeflea sp.]|uniref:hypothetical protein n=1 Tax=Hoeflea sp. TaxID=1940281 RepID=UPI003A9288C7